MICNFNMSPKKAAEKLVADYCKEFGVNPNDLKKAYGKTGRCKVIGSVHIDRMRMSLAYYLNKNTNLSLSVIAEVVGYKCHSTICQNRDKVSFYIENDKDFIPYWKVIVEKGVIIFR